MTHYPISEPLSTTVKIRSFPYCKKGLGLKKFSGISSSLNRSSHLRSGSDISEKGFLDTVEANVSNTNVVENRPLEKSVEDLILLADDSNYDLVANEAREKNLRLKDERQNFVGQKKAAIL